MYKLLRQRFFMQSQGAMYCMQQHPRHGAQKGDKNRVAKIKTYWFNRYIDYIKNYEQVLQRNFPRTMHVYRVFTVGTKQFICEVKEYVVILKKQTVSSYDTLTLRELQLAHTMRKDLVKICPVLLISAIPFTNYVIFPLAYYFPRYLLTSHYWTLEQKLEFMLLEQKKRLKHNEPLYRYMQAVVPINKTRMLKLKWSDIVACLGSGTHPETKNIIACSELFSGHPYSLENLKRGHTKELLAIHGISSWTLFRKRKLMERGMLIKRMDRAIQKEGGTTKLSNDALQWALSFRGLNPEDMPMESMRDWLKHWLVISNAVDESNISLLLHSPILLAYNHPTNRLLMHSGRVCKKGGHVSA